MMHVLSPIYPADVLPVRDGWYLTRRPGMSLEMMTEWRGGKWNCPIRGDQIDQRRFWRGLDFDPAGAIPDVKWLAEHPGAVRSSPVGGVFVPGAQCC